MGSDGRCYAVYGLRVESTRPLQGIRSVSTDESGPDVRIVFSDVPPPPQDRAEILSETRVVRVSCVGLGAWTVLEYAAGGTFFIDARGSRVHVLGSGDAADEDVIRLLLGAVMGIVLRLRGRTCVHGAVLQKGGQAFALLAPSGFGKSTLSASLLGEGCTLVSDDVLALRQDGEEFHALPGLPRIRLWQDAIDALRRAGAPPGPLSDSHPKRLWDLTGDAARIHTRPCPLAAVYTLRPGGDSLPHPHVEGLAGADVLVSLLANTYPSPEHFPLPQEIRAREFDVLARLVGRTSVNRVIYRKDPTLLPAICHTILAHLESLETGPPCSTTT